MSEAIAFDTHRFVKHLTEKGFTEEQAEALAIEQINLLNGSLATKTDIALIQQTLEALRQETAVSIETLRKETAVLIETLRKETAVSIETLRKETTVSIEAFQKETKATIETLQKETTVSIEALRKEITVSIEALRQETKATIETTKSDLLKWTFGGLIGQGGLIVALIKLL